MIRIDRAPQAQSGRDDGPGQEHLRWFKKIELVEGQNPDLTGQDVVLIGFASDEGVRRNKGRQGARNAPAALRAALAPLAVSTEQAHVKVADLGDVVVNETDHDPAADGPGDILAEGQQRLADNVAATIDAAALPIVLGGGHEVAFGTYSGVASAKKRAGKRVGILNLDAHFDLRAADRPSSGTPFRQALEAEKAAGTELSYAIVGISQPSNTQVLFDTAEEFGVRYLLDENCQESDRAEVVRFVEEFVAGVDVLYLTVDLDVLPASVAPGVSAPAAYGVPLPVILDAARAAAASGKLVAADVAELNPEFDLDSRTAKSAARILHTIMCNHQKEQS